MSVPSFKLKPNANARVLSGHPWVFANEVEAPLPPECDGEVVECRDRAGRLLGTGICNGRSQITSATIMTTGHILHSQREHRTAGLVQQLRAVSFLTRDSAGCIIATIERLSPN